MSAPSVYAAISAITAEFAAKGIAKTLTNPVDDYKYRSIDNVLDRLAPLLARHKLCILPRVRRREVTERVDEQGRLLVHVALKLSLTLTSVDDASTHVVEAYGEALDASDKATAKAMSAAYKSAMIQTFCIPCSGNEDADRTSLKPAKMSRGAEPLQGWTQWCLDVEDIIGLCESQAALRSVQDRYRESLTALRCERPDLYAQLGAAFESRREALEQRRSAPKTRARGQAKVLRRASGPRHSAPPAAVEHA